MSTGDPELREATLDDARFLFDLRNLPAVRNQFRDSREIDWSEHVNWLQSRLRSGDERVYIINYEKNSAGYIRLKRDGEISLGLIPQYWGKGIGSFAIREICKLSTTLYPALKNLFAYALSTNTGSVKAFERAGFREKGEANGLTFLELLPTSTGESLK